MAPVVPSDKSLSQVDKYLQNPLCYPLYSDLSGGLRYPPFEQPAPDQELKFLNSIAQELEIFHNHCCDTGFILDILRIFILR